MRPDHQLALDIMEALNVPTKGASHFTLEIGVGKAPTVTVEYVVRHNSSLLPSTQTLLRKQFRLVDVDEPASDDLKIAAAVGRAIARDR